MHDARTHNEYCTSTKNISHELNSICTKSRGRDASGHMTYFHSTQFAVYNGMNHGYKNATVTE